MHYQHYDEMEAASVLEAKRNKVTVKAVLLYALDSLPLFGTGFIFGVLAGVMIAVSVMVRVLDSPEVAKYYATPEEMAARVSK